MLTITLASPVRDRTIIGTITRTIARNARRAWRQTHPWLARVTFTGACIALTWISYALDRIVYRPGQWCAHHAARGIAWACRELGELAEDIARRTK